MCTNTSRILSPETRANLRREPDADADDDEDVELDGAAWRIRGSARLFLGFLLGASHESNARRVWTSKQGNIASGQQGQVS